MESYDIRHINIDTNSYSSRTHLPGEGLGEGVHLQVLTPPHLISPPQGGKEKVFSDGILPA